MFIGVPVFSVKDLGWETALPEMLSDFQLADGSEVLRERIHSAIVTDNALFGMVSRDQRNYAVSKWDASVIKPKWEAFLKNI